MLFDPTPQEPVCSVDFRQVDDSCGHTIHLEGRSSYSDRELLVCQRCITWAIMGSGSSNTPGFNRTEMTSKFEEIWDIEAGYCRLSIEVAPCDFGPEHEVRMTPKILILKYFNRDTDDNTIGSWGT